MNIFRYCRPLFVCGGVLMCLCINVLAQQSASSASVSQSRAIVNSSPRNSNNSNYYRPAVNFKAPDEVAVEEFVNYHKHRLSMPKAGQAVALDTRWGNDRISSSQREAVLQIGFATAEVTERTDLRPLNLVLVIDKSGSMRESDKMSRVKESLRTLVAKLRPEDFVSIVVFDDAAEVLYPAARIADGYELRRAIDCIQPNGSTNLHGGLMLGYREALKNYRQDATNRVILLTDGIANVGVVDPGEIAAESSEFNGQGLDLSTIGVGLNLNNDLLRTLATSGRGLYHFVSDYQDIEKVFVTEVQSLLSQVAKRVAVTIDYDPNLQIEKIYGYSPANRANSVSIKLDDMNNGLTQVVMIRFRSKDLLKSPSSVRVRLSYFDVLRQKTVEETQTAVLQTSNEKNCDLLADVEVRKNYTIAGLAQSLFDMTEAAKLGNYREAESALNGAVSETSKRFPSMEDKDVRFILNIVEGYQRDLKTLNRQRQTDDCGNCK